MACGTPTIAFNRGSVPEVITKGVTGIVVDNMRDAIQAVPRVVMISRDACRTEFERRFTARRMARDYVALYEAVLGNEPDGDERSTVDPVLDLQLSRIVTA
jgi:glycosyltransferase involved in cell wall biosynthesis